MALMGINYAKFVGIHSIAAAIVFAVVYVPLFAWFLRQSFGRPTYVFVVLALFCAIRITAFTIRAILAGVNSAGENLNLLIADQVLFGVGFFGLLYSAYTLVLDRWLLVDPHKSRTGLISRVMKNRRLFRVILIAAVALGTAGAVQATSANPKTGDSLRVASTAIFLVLTVLTAHQTLHLAQAELNYDAVDSTGSIGRVYGAYILVIIALLLLVREAFATATVKNLAKQYDERLWYPLYALPEVLAVFLYATPGLVPPRSELPT